MSADEVGQERASLGLEKIDWHPVRWGTGNSISDKVGGIFRVLLSGIRIGISERPSLIHSRSSLTVLMAVILKRIFRAKFLYDADSMLSDEYAETGYLMPNSRALRFLAWSESLGRRNADQIIVLTNVLKSDYRDKLGVTVPIDVIPCCVDLDRFKNVAKMRIARRTEIGISETTKLYIYVGKAGSWYMIDETFELFRTAVQIDPESKLLVITSDPYEVFLEAAGRAGVAQESFFVRNAGYSIVGEWMSAADIALSLVKPLSSKRGSSPVKFAEYLACGLPVIATAGIGDIDCLINEYRIGTLIDRFSYDGYRSAIDSIASLDDVGDRCREVAKREFDLVDVGGVRYRRIYSRLLNGAAH